MPSHQSWKATACPNSCMTSPCTSITEPRSVLYQSSSAGEVNSFISSSSYSRIIEYDRWYGVWMPRKKT